jgi:hypothetical protein
MIDCPSLLCPLVSVFDGPTHATAQRTGILKIPYNTTLGFCTIHSGSIVPIIHSLTKKTAAKTMYYLNLAGRLMFRPPLDVRMGGGSRA